MSCREARLQRPLSLAALAVCAAEPAWLGASWAGAALPADGASGFAPDALPLQHIAAPLLGGGLPAEGWFGRAPVRGGVAHGVRYRCDGQLLFGVIDIDEAAFAPRADAAPLQQAGQHAYDSLFRLLADEGYPQLWRVWNYLADINADAGGLERYRQFNIGRHQAFESAGRLAGDTIPAASALGVTGAAAAGRLSIAFLAARSAGRPVENPRQTSAWRYPADYGPRSPTFSRAMLARLPGQEWLFVSGTASIVGHATRHPGDPAAQTRETVANLDAVLAAASRSGGGPAWRRDELSCRAYVRHPAQLPAIEGELRRALGAAAPIVFIHADVCRADLLVEVEAQACHAA